jgi:hypothetical protein
VREGVQVGADGMNNDDAKRIAEQMEAYLKRFTLPEEYDDARDTLMALMLSYGDAVAAVTTTGAIQGMQNAFDKVCGKWN